MIKAIERYLLMRKNLGYVDADLPRELRAFATFAAKRGALFIRVDDALAWVEDRGRYRFELLACVKRLGRYLRAEDVRHEIVPDIYTQPPPRSGRRVPFIYSDEEVRAVMAGFRRLSFPHPYDAATYEHLIGLIAVTGLRVSEAIGLGGEDLRSDSILVSNGKFGKDRRVYIDRTTQLAMNRYLRARPPEFDSLDLFVIHTNRAPSKSTVEAKFRRCTNLLGMTGRPNTGLPCIHDLRHTFVVRSLANCPLHRREVSKHAVALSTYLGHVSLESTYWYCDVTPDTKMLMAQTMEDMINV